MTISLKHKFQSAKADSSDASLIRPSSWNDEHNITLAASRLIGRAASTDGAAQEITLGAGLAFSGTSIVVNGSAVTGLNASNLASGTIPDARLNAGSYTMSVLTLTNRLVVSGSAPNIQLIDTTSGQLSARLRVDANNAYFDSSADDVTFTEVFRFELDTKVGYVNGQVIHTNGNTLNIGATAATARAAMGLGGLATQNIADLMYTGTSNSNTSFPVGSYVSVFTGNDAVARNASIVPCVSTSDTHFFRIQGSSGAGAALTGTWRSRGGADADGDRRFVFAQRVS